MHAETNTQRAHTAHRGPEFFAYAFQQDRIPFGLRMQQMGRFVSSAQTTADALSNNIDHNMHKVRACPPSDPEGGAPGANAALR